MSTRQPYKGPIGGPCSACGDGDTAMKYHDHSNLRQFPVRALHLSSRTMLISLTEYERLVDEFCNERAKTESVNDNTLRRLRLGELILWLRKREEESNFEHQKDRKLQQPS